MKRLISILLAVFLVLSVCVCASAAEPGSIRHLVTGDVSEFIVDEEAGLSESKSDEAQKQATVGTDVYLYVDPDSASYITFVVIDEDHESIPGASIYITYNGVEELYGVTDETGCCRFYLFRNVEYGYRVTKGGYEPATGHFTATEETKEVVVVLRKLHRLDVYVIDHDEPVPEYNVKVDNIDYTTDENGRAHTERANGTYTVTVTSRDGREIIRVVSIRGKDVVLIVDISADDIIIPGGTYGDRFLVYDREYDPEDYVLTKYTYTREDVVREENETDEDYEKRVEEYLAAHPNIITIEAQCDRIQQESGPDIDVVDEEGKLVYTQRSLMPTGFLLKAWEEEQFQYIVFTDEDCGISFSLQSLHSGEVMKTWAALMAKRDLGGHMETILSKKYREEKDWYKNSRIAWLEGKFFDQRQAEMEAIDEFVFGFDEEENETRRTLEDKVYTNTMFEFRICPIEKEAVLAMVKDGLEGEKAFTPERLVLLNRNYYNEELRYWMSLGNLDDLEAAALFELTVDGVVTEDELAQLRQDYTDGKLSDEALQAFADAVLAGRLYRVGCYIRYGAFTADITEYMSDLHMFLLADEMAEDLTEEEITALPGLYELLRVNDRGVKPTAEDYEKGVNTALYPAKAVNTLSADDPYIDVISEKELPVIVMDVREETMSLADGKTGLIFRGYPTFETAKPESHLLLAVHDCASGLAGLVYAK